MSQLVDFEGKPAENLVRASVDADLGALLLRSVKDPDIRQLLEEAIIGFSHDMIEVGRTLGRESMEDAVQKALFTGLTEGMDLTIKGRENNGNNSEE